MELALNLAWLAVALIILWAWVRCASEKTRERRLQAVALLMLVLILLPAISITDDLLAAQNVAETESFGTQRRDHDFLRPLLIAPVADLVPGIFTGLILSPLKVSVPADLTVSPPDELSLVSLESRAPPAV